MKEIQKVKKAISAPIQPTVPKWSQIVAQTPLKPPTPPITTELTLHFPEQQDR